MPLPLFAGGGLAPRGLGRREANWRWVVALALVLGSSPAAAQESQRKPGDRPATVTATWRGVPARSVCRRLTELTGRPVILDRRLDPDTPITIAAEATPLVDLLGEIAASLGGRCAILPASIRIVPGHAAALVAADTERTRTLASLPPALRRLAARRAPWAWGDGARPRDLLAEIADRASIDLAGLDDVPHDHLAAADLPALPLAERLDLLLAQFDRRIDWRGARSDSDRVGLAIVPLPSPPDDDGALVVAPAGPPLDTAVKPPRPGGAPRPLAPGMATWTLEVAAPLDQLLATVAMRLELELALDREGLRTKGIAPAEIVRLSVREVDRETLLDRIVEPLDLEWAIDGHILRVGPKGD